MSTIVGDPGGPQVVLGHDQPIVLRGQRRDSIVVGVQPDGSWAPIELPQGPVDDVIAHDTFDGELLLLTAKGDQYQLYRSTDGVTFAGESVALPEGSAASLSGLVVSAGHALVDRDGSLLIGGIFRHQAVVWSVDVPVTD